MQAVQQDVATQPGLFATLPQREFAVLLPSSSTHSSNKTFNDFELKEFNEFAMRTDAWSHLASIRKTNHNWQGMLW
jgi:hypothetical protein